jgi:hypothetical protein
VQLRRFAEVWACPAAQPKADADDARRRHSNKLTRGRNDIAKICGFVRDAGMCLAPPSSWVRFYRGVVARTQEE